jgi:hypothetical protein
METDILGQDRRFRANIRTRELPNIKQKSQPHDGDIQ